MGDDDVLKLEPWASNASLESCRPIVLDCTVDMGEMIVSYVLFLLGEAEPRSSLNGLAPYAGECGEDDVATVDDRS